MICGTDCTVDIRIQAVSYTHLPSILFYAWHLLIGLVLIFLYKPLGGAKELSPGLRTLCRVVDWILIALTAVVSFYVILNFETYTTTMQNNMMTKELYVLSLIHI